jgi:6-hydroxycyclohex-1-ene-1-carbonyl-CoA dehydrogenase
MKAALFVGPNRPLEIALVPTPAPAAGEVLVRVAACGLCHTDLHYLDHGTPTFKKPPLILGHEISGTIAGLGTDVADVTDIAGWALGDPVLLPAVLTCGHCRPCREGRENICDQSRMFGNHVDGGFAEFVVAPAKEICRLPAEIPLEAAAIIADALTTPFHAVVRRGRVAPGDWVLVLGCGGVGLNLVQMAVAVGGRVIAVDVSADKLAWATRLGAELVLDAAAVGRLDKAVRAATGGSGVDVAFEAIGKAATQEQAFACLRNGGRLVLVGYSPETMALNAGRVMFREIEVMGSLGCRPVDYPRVIALAAQGKIRVADLVTHRFSLDQINQGLDALRAGLPVRAIVVP